MDPLVLRKINDSVRQRRAVVHVVQLADGRDRAVREGEPVAGELGQAVAAAFRTGRAGLVRADGEDWFLNVHLPAPRLVIIGAVHVSQSLAPMAALAGFDVRVIDPRSGFATPGRFPGTVLRAGWPQDVLAQEPLDAWTALAALTHDPKIDDPALIAALAAGCFYVGALGSRRTHAQRLERLHAAGLGRDETERIEAPIGLDIGAANPAEIAVAVLGSVIRALRQRPLAETPPRAA